jgi:hypothetical protein
MTELKYTNRKENGQRKTEKKGSVEVSTNIPREIYGDNTFTKLLWYFMWYEVFCVREK